MSWIIPITIIILWALAAWAIARHFRRRKNLGGGRN
jgi:hypothetical protein